MKPKAIITGALLVFVLGSVVYLLAREMRRPGPVADSPAAAGDRNDSVPTATTVTVSTQAATGPRKGVRKVIAYYFHGDARCVSCLRIEAWSRSAIHDTFADDIRRGLLEWRTVNADEPGNEHFVRDFQLYTKSVVLVETLDGKRTRWKNLNRIWELLRDRAAFSSYIRRQTRSFLKG